MRKISILLAMTVSVVANAQLKTVNANVDGMGLSVGPKNYSRSITSLLNLSDDFSFRNNASRFVADKMGATHFTLDQYYKGIPVENASIKLHIREKSLYYINGNYLATPPENEGPQLAEGGALQYALTYTGAKKYIWEDQAELKLIHETLPDNLLYPAPHAQVVYYVAEEEKARPAYKFDVYAVEPLSRNYVYVDGITGKILGTHNLICSVVGSADTRYSGNRSICTDYFGSSYRLRDYSCSRGNGVETYNMAFGTNYAAATDFTDNDNAWTAAEYHGVYKDDAALDAHWGAEMTYDYFKNVHNRNSIDNAGYIMKNYVHYDVNIRNAFWDGIRMTYGNGNSVSPYYRDAYTSLDIVAHEISHGFCQYAAGVGTSNEPGAINESLSDIWAACVEYATDPSKSRWQIAEEIDLDDHTGIRSMSNPNSKGQPDTYWGSYWYNVIGCTSIPGPGGNDLCGVHTNSGVMNYWFYLLTVGGAGTNDLGNGYNVSAIGINDAAAIVYRAEDVYMNYYTDLPAARIYTMQAARDLFGDCSPQLVSTANAWYAVGVGNQASAPADTLAITALIGSGAIQDYFAQRIYAYNTIMATAKIKYEATKKVILYPGFKADAGSTFLARIVTCLDYYNKNATMDPDDTPEAEPAVSLIDALPGGVRIYPNPATESIRVLIPGNNERLTIRIYDMNGRLIQSETAVSPITEIDLQRLMNGIYLVDVTTSTGNSRYKIIKN